VTFVRHFYMQVEALTGSGLLGAAHLGHRACTRQCKPFDFLRHLQRAMQVAHPHCQARETRKASNWVLLECACLVVQHH
jgi:hypothetical protein